MKDLFARITAKSEDTDFSLSVSYLEIYNETIRDLLEPEKGALQLRESNGTATPAGLSTKEPKDAFDVVEWITLGNQNRTVNATEANATSSRSHAVLRVTVTQKPKAGGLTDTQQSATLSVIDLAGSERASVTKNKGDRLIEGANINRSLLALGNCINALCDPRKRGHVPYRDSKLTRLLKQSLGGNCKTVMIVCVSPSSAHYDETHNTLQYANRAKEIKTKAIRNVISVDRHVAQYCQQIMQQAEQIELLKKQLAEKGSSTGGGLEERDEDARAVNAAKIKIHSSWDTGKSRQVDIERAQVEKNAVDSVLAILQQWKATALSSVDIPSSPGSSTAAAASTLNLVRANCDSLISNMSAASTRLRSEIQAGAGAMDMYTSMATSLTSSMRSSRLSALSTFQLELKVLEGRLGAAVAEAREQGMREASKCQARVMHAMCDARAKVGGAIDAAREEGGEAERALVRLSHGIDNANRDAFSALVAGGGSSGGSSGTKRDSGTRSPLADDMWTTKSPRAAMGGVGSAPSGQLSVGGQAPRPPVVSTFARRSPRKSVAFQSRKVDTSSLKSSPKKRKEVQWRDETGDGWELEDVKWRSPSTPDVLGSGASSSSAASPSFPAVTVTSAPPVSAMWSSTSTVQHGATASAAEMMALKARSSSTLGALRTKPAASRLSPLPRVSEVNSANFFSRDSPSSASMPPPPVPSSSRTPFSDVGNSSITSNASSDSSFSHHSTSMAPTSSGLFAPIVSSSSASCAPTPTAVADTPRRAAAARRRISNIGPLRSTKSTRRTSFITPPTPAGSSSTLQGATRKAARLPGGAPSIPQSARKSPRKLMSSASAGARRASLMAPTPTSFPGFGAKSAARIAARRESSIAAVGGPSAGGLLGGGGRNSTDGLQAAGAALFSRSRDSPTTAGGKPTLPPSTHWR